MSRRFGVDSRQGASSSQVSAPTGPQPVPQRAVDDERCLTSEDILRGAKTVVIEHRGATYRLQATKQGKLILTK